MEELNIATPILYSTLPPLSAAAAAADHLAPPPSSSSDEDEPYVVFRSEISQSQSILECNSPETAAPDYFSLDGGGGDVEGEGDGGEMVLVPLIDAKPLRFKEPERGLEGNWFRANCRFKSPMIQLHKDSYEPYIVFGGEISQSQSILECNSPETAAPDYFSLDGDGDGEGDGGEMVLAPVVIDAKPFRFKEPERGLEWNWFRANCRFKSPMIQLHKGDGGEMVLAPVIDAKPFRFKEPERGLEWNWFRANCRFKSPMIQLHKGDGGEMVLAPVIDAKPFRFKEPERGLEWNWFRANCRFKSPMIQLHKGDGGEMVLAPVIDAKPFRFKEPERGLEWNWFRANCRFKSPMIQLHKEIVDFCEFLSPTPEEQASRNEAIKCVFNVIKYIWPNCKPEVFGSFKTGLYLPTSDVDLVILGSEIRSPQIGLQALSRALSQKGVAKKIQVISKARVPIIKFVEKKSGISFDISFDLDNGPKAAEFIKDAMSSWPPLRPLCLILKVFLQQRELNEVYTGGIGSYALLVMLIAMLQNHRNGKASAEQNLGVLLVNFFDIYGRKLNTSDVGVSCNGVGTFFLKSSKGFSIKGKQSLISIEDPQTPENDIGKSSFNYFQVRSAFAMAFTTLTNPEAIRALGPNRSILGTIIRPDEILVERKGGSNGEVTFNSLLPGAGERLQQYSDNQQEIYCNWQLNDDDEEALPRGNGTAEDGGAQSSGKKRKTSKEKQSAKKVKEGGHSSNVGDEEKSSGKKRKMSKEKQPANCRYEEYSSWKEKSSKKHWKHNRL